VQFLLFLSAMLAGLSGLVSGDRAVEPRQVEQALAAAAAVAEIAPACVEAVTPVPLPAAATPQAIRPALPGAAPRLAGRAPVDERRLE
jgi:hypothetical protein